MPVSVIPALTTKRQFTTQHSRAHDHRSCEPLGRSGGMLPREKKIKICASKMPFPAFWDHNWWTIVEFFFLDFLTE